MANATVDLHIEYAWNFASSYEANVLYQNTMQTHGNKTCYAVLKFESHMGLHGERHTCIIQMHAWQVHCVMQIFRVKSEL